MKAEIAYGGTLVITPENWTEDFAIRMWWENYVKVMNSIDPPPQFKYDMKIASYPPILE